MMFHIQMVLRIVCMLVAFSTPVWAHLVTLLEGYSVPYFNLQDLNTKSQFDIDNYFNNDDPQNDKVVVITFFANWCAPCKEEMPELQHLYDVHKTKGLQVLAITNEISDTDSSCLWFNDNKIKVPLLSDNGGKVSKKYDVNQYPTTFIVGKDGTIVKKIIGYNEATKNTFEKLLVQLLR